MGVHIHIAVANSAGQVCGGHRCLGSPVYTTAEIVIGANSDMRFSRKHDPQTGYLELAIVRDKEGSSQ